MPSGTSGKMHQTEKNVPLEEVLIQCCHWWLNFHIVSSDSIIFTLTLDDFFCDAFAFFYASMWIHRFRQELIFGCWLKKLLEPLVSCEQWHLSATPDAHRSMAHKNPCFQCWKRLWSLMLSAVKRKLFQTCSTQCHFFLCFAVTCITSTLFFQVKSAKKVFTLVFLFAFLQQTSNLKSKLNEICELGRKCCVLIWEINCELWF